MRGVFGLKQADNMLNQTVHHCTSVDFLFWLGQIYGEMNTYSANSFWTLSTGHYFVNQNTILQPSELEEICLLSIESVLINLFSHKTIW